MVDGRHNLTPRKRVDGRGSGVVEGGARHAHSSDVPTIASLLNNYRDRTGASYKDMSRRSGDVLTVARLQQLATAPPKEFPKHTRTMEALASLLEVPLATIVLAFAAGLGMPVRDSGPLLALSLPPGTDNLTDRDRDAILAVTRQLIAARSRQVPVPAPDLSRVQGLRLAEPETLRTVHDLPDGK